MKRAIGLMLMAILCMTAVSCTEKNTQVTEEYLDVNANNISGKWELVEWNGAVLTGGTYVFLDIVRNDRTYTMHLPNILKIAESDKTLKKGLNI